VALVLSVATADAGVVQTHTERLTGDLAVRTGGLAVGDRVVKADEVLWALLGRAGRTLPQPNVVRRTNGEVWQCEILSLAAGKLTFRSPLLGLKHVDRRGIAALEFQPKLPRGEALEAGTLYRKEGEPLPGSLLWISPTQVAVDSPLGAMAMDRRTVTRLIVTRGAAARAGHGVCEVALADGSVLRGVARFEEGAVALRHDVLGELALPARAVRSVLRHCPKVAWLTELPYRAEVRRLLAGAGRIKTVDRRMADRPNGRSAGPHCIRSLRIEPTTKVTYRLPGEPAGRRVLRTALWAAPGAKGEARLRISAGGNVRLERAVPPSQTAAVPVTVELGEATELTVEVTFGRRVALPCGVVLGDPHVVGR